MNKRKGAEVGSAVGKAGRFRILYSPLMQSRECKSIEGVWAQGGTRVGHMPLADCKSKIAINIGTEDEARFAHVVIIPISRQLFD